MSAAAVLPAMRRRAESIEKGRNSVIRECAVAALLLANAISDVMAREILLFPTGAFLVGGLAAKMLYAWWKQTTIPTSFFLCLLPGIVLLIIAWVTRGKIGAGDGLLFLTMGVWLSWREIVLLLTLSFFLAGAAAGILLFRKHSGKETFPFVPFILAAWILTEAALLGGLF